jgi:ribonuclease P protein component
VWRGDGEGARLGITVTRKVGNAVRRNRIKRLVREWFRSRRGGLGTCDLVVIAKQGISARLSRDDVAEDLESAWRRLARCKPE